MAATGATIVSCPGKVLLAGGYLVLDPNYSGIVVSTSSRFYTVIESSTSAAAAAEVTSYRVSVRSPQFTSAEWIYTVSFNDKSIIVEQHEDS